MKKFSICLIAALLLCGSFSGCGEEPDPGPDPGPGPNGNVGEEFTERELIFDSNFEKGLKVSGLNSHAFAYTWWRYAGKDEPVWSLGQYCDLSVTRDNYDSSKNDLSLGDEDFGIESKGIEGKDGDRFTLTNQSGSKWIAVDPAKGEVELRADTSKEYIDGTTGAVVPRANGEDWVHMILQQNCSEVRLSEAESFTMTLDFTLNESELYNAQGGTSQFQWIFSVHDKTHSVAPNAEYFWFNVTLYDARYEIFPGTSSIDGGKADSTGKYIYAPTGEELFGESGGKVEIGKKYHVSLDLKAHMQRALEEAKKLGAMKNSSWEDLTVNSFNIGWEVTDVSKVSVTLGGLSLKVKEKK